MENTFFEIKIQFTKTDNRGASKRTSSSYGVRALTFSEVEQIVTRYAVSQHFDDLIIRSVRPIPLAGFLACGGETYFLVRVKNLIVDEKSGEEKSVSFTWLVRSADVESASADLRDYLLTSGQNYEILSVRQSPITAVLK